MKVAQIMAGAQVGGAELFFERLCMALLGAGDDVLPIIRTDEARATRLAALPVQQLAFGGALDTVTGRRLRSALREFAPRVAVAWMNRAARFAPQGDWVLAGRLGGFYDLDYYRRCDHLIGNTHGIVSYIRDQGWPAARAHYLPNFVPDMAAPPAPANRRVLAMGRLHPNKGFDTLIRAAARMAGARVVIAGEGPERDALIALAQRERVADRVAFPGWSHDTASLLANAAVLACPSRHEPLGNVVLEAWSAGRPVVAAAADGPRELIHPGRDGLLVPIDDPAALAQSLSRVMDDPALAARLAQGGRARYEAEFAPAPVLARWRNTFATLETA